MRNFKCYRVWFADGSCLLTDAESSHMAKIQAEELARKQNGNTKVKTVECLDRED